MIYITIFTFILILIDQIIKIIIDKNILLNSSIEIINNFFNITYVRNIGAAFSILEGNRIFLILIAIMSILLIYKFFIKDKKITKQDILIYSMLFGGIIGNLIDRIIRGYVIDYLDFNILGYNFAIFNLADVLIVISIFFLLLKMYRGEKNETRNKR